MSAPLAPARRRACAAASASRVAEEPLERGGHRFHVTGRHDRAGSEPADDLAESADVVDDRRDTRAEHLEQRAGDVDLRAVREQPDGRFRKRAPQLRVREVAEPPLGTVARRLVAGRRAERAGRRRRGAARRRRRARLRPRPPSPCTAGSARGRGRCGRRPPVSTSERKTGWPMTRTFSARKTEVDELPAPALRVDDHALEAIEERLPHRRLRQRAARDDVVCGEDSGAARPEEPAIQLRRAEPLHVQHIRLREPEARHAERMLERFHARDATAVLPCETRADRTTRVPRSLAARPPIRSGTATSRARPRRPRGRVRRPATGRTAACRRAGRR